MKAAVIGCGRMGAQPSSRSTGQLPEGWVPIAHAEALVAAGIPLVALCDPNAQSLADAGERYGVAARYADYRELIRDVRPDILTIATRTPIKAEIVRFACSHGVRGLYVEKPLANSRAECRALLAETAAAGVKLAYGVNRRYHAAYREARRRIAAGEIGELRSIAVELGAAPLLWTHPHSVDQMLFLAGSTDVVGAQARATPASLAPLDANRLDSDPVLEYAALDFASGLRGFILPAPGLGIRVGGSAGILTIHANGARLQLDRRADAASPYFLRTETIETLADEGATVRALRELVESVRSGASPGIAPAEIETGLRMLLACAWSAAHGSAHVALDRVPDDFTVTGRTGTLHA